MSGYERLKAIQERLEARGVTDVKFAWSRGAREKPLSQVANEVADALEAYLDGRFRPLPPFNDLPSPPDTCEETVTGN